MRKANLNILAAVFMFMIFAGPAWAVTYYVNPGDSIQAAIDASAMTGDEIEVAPGTYNEAINFNGKAVRLYSSGGSGVTIINGTGNYHVVQCVSGEDANTTLEGFTITGGNADGPDNDLYGGGMYNDGSSPTVIKCMFTENSAGYGGGMLNNGSSPIVTDCNFTYNITSNYGGGMENYNNSNPMVTGCTFNDNFANYGGGMFNNSSSPTVINCEFSYNTVMTNGGGIYNRDCNPNLTNCVFTDNIAQSPTYGGGGMFNYTSNPMVTNCTFIYNAALHGGGIYNYNNSSSTVTNCILWGDTPDEIYDTGTSSSSVNYCDIQGGWSGAGGNNIDADPIFVNAASGDLRLSSDASPCVDAGDNSALPADTSDLDGDGNTVEAIPIDLYGNPRVFDGDENGSVIVDMGAYEYREPLPELVAHWKLDETAGIIASDSSGNAHHGTLYGNPNWQPAGGQVGGALQLDGVDDYVDCGNDDSLNIVNEITLAVWVKTNDAGNSEHNPYVMKGDYSYGLKHRSTNNIEFFIFDGGWYFIRYDVDSSFNGVWHHIVGTYDGNELKLYIDSRLVATTAHTGSINISAYNVNIGRNSMIHDRLYSGMIDDVRIYNYALTADEILDLLCTEPIKSDLDGNCRVDFRDFALLLSEWLTCNLPREEFCW